MVTSKPIKEIENYSDSSPIFYEVKLLKKDIENIENSILEKEKNFERRVSALESSQDQRQNRIFQWKTLFIGWLLGLLSTIIFNSLNSLI